MTTHNPHIEAAAAAIFSEEFQDYPLTFDMAKDMAQAAITAYCESLASVGENGVVITMRKAAQDEFSEMLPLTDEDMDTCMRAALAVTRAADAQRLAEVERERDTLRTALSAINLRATVALEDDIAADSEKQALGLLSRHMRVIQEIAEDAARATEGGGHE